MKSALLLSVVALSLLTVARARAEESVYSSSVGSVANPQLITLEAGQIEPHSVAFNNGSYQFNYSPDALKSPWVEAVVGAHLFDALYGSFYFEEGLAYTSFEGALLADAPGNAGKSLSVMMFGFDSRLMYQARWFPLKFVIPFADAGYQYTLYYQSGPSDLQSAEGGIGNAVAGAGLQFWLNRGATYPVFITAKLNQIFPRSGGLDLESRTFLAGLTVGI